MTERMSRTAVPRRVTAPHALASSAPVAHRHTGQHDIAIDCHISCDCTAGNGVVTVEPGDDPSFSVLAAADGWSPDVEAPYRSIGGWADCDTTYFAVPEGEHHTFTEAPAARLGGFSAGLLPTASGHPR